MTNITTNITKQHHRHHYKYHGDNIESAVSNWIDRPDTQYIIQTKKTQH